MLISPQIPESDKLDGPCYSYNCHSYAWYNRSNNNEYWINLPNDFISDPHCSDELTFSQLKIGDIVTYWTEGEYYDNYGNFCQGYYCAHSAVVVSIEGNSIETIKCESKWGPAGLYRHKIDDVPPEYKYNGVIDVKYYHYTQGKHEGSNYLFSGNLYYHNATCTICELVYTEPHSWVSYNTSYRCTLCGKISDQAPSIQQNIPPIGDEEAMENVPGIETEEVIVALPPVNDEEELTE